jgi:murein DD-endopeptidase MepM/ murein hydrolase activator NlpD
VTSLDHKMFSPPGELVLNSGEGVKSEKIYAPWIRFPVAKKPAYINSQVYGVGGRLGPKTPKGGWGHPANYKYPWHDNFCERRDRRTSACPSGLGHQGVDIRPAGPEDRKYSAVAVESGRIVKIGSYSVTLAGESGTQYNYLHLEMADLKVSLGQRVVTGQVIGLISNDFKGTPTPVHLHFEIRQNVNGRGWQHVPPYTSLVAAYQAM